MKEIRRFIVEFKPALQFLGVFVISYAVLSLAYGFYIESFGDKVDPWTRSVSKQTAYFLSKSREQVISIDSYRTRSCALATAKGEILSVYEGCNGLNVVILFISFLLAYKGPVKKFLVFSSIGIILIHAVNLARIGLLYFVAQHYPNYMYFTHKYLFTTVIYAVVFGLWYLWVSKYNANPKIFKIAPGT